MERSWLQEQTALSRFDGFRESQPLSCVKPTEAPAPSSLLSTASRPAPEAGHVDVVYDPQDASADWSGFAPRHCAGRRMHPGRPAAHRETIARSEEHGFVPAADAATEDSARTRRRRYTKPARMGEGLLLGGPVAPGPEERFTTSARAANGREPTPWELKSEACRYQRALGKKHVTPAYERGVAAAHGTIAAWRAGQVGDGHPSLAPLGAPLRNSASSRSAEAAESIIIAYPARAAPNAPGSFLKGLGRHIVESGAVAGQSSSGSREGGGGMGAEKANSARSGGVRRNELFASNYNPHMPGYTGYWPHR